MAKFRNQIAQYTIRFGDKYFSFKNGKDEWVDNRDNANRYGSPYAAKTHMKTVLTNPPSDVWYEIVNQ
jgi:hypothetical protein